MNTSHTAWYIRIVFACIAMILFATWGVNAVHADESASSITIAPTGQVIVKGARVTSVSGNSIHAEAEWGAAQIAFVVQTTGSTRFMPDLGSSEALRAIKKGHTISFTGTLSGTIAKPTVVATVLRDAELLKEAVSVVGTVRSVDEESGTFVLEQSDAVTTILVPVGALMSRDGNYARVANIQVGDSAKATGTLDTAQSILRASRVTVVTPEVENAPIEEELPEMASENVLSSFIGWLKGSRGILSVR